MYLVLIRDEKFWVSPRMLRAFFRKGLYGYTLILFLNKVRDVKITMTDSPLASIRSWVTMLLLLTLDVLSVFVQKLSYISSIVSPPQEAPYDCVRSVDIPFANRDMFQILKSAMCLLTCAYFLYSNIKLVDLFKSCNTITWITSIGKHMLFWVERQIGRVCFCKSNECMMKDG